MTGHWQILGSARVPLQEMVKIDYRYVAGWSLWQDTKILLRTVTYVLRCAGCDACQRAATTRTRSVWTFRPRASG